MPVAACLADLDRDLQQVGNTVEEVFAAGVVAAVVAAAVAVVAVAAVDVAVVDQHHCVAVIEAVVVVVMVVVVVVGPGKVEVGCQENAAVEFAAAAVMGPLLLGHVVVLGEVVLAQDQAVLTAVERKVREQEMSSFPAAAVPCWVEVHWPQLNQVRLLLHQDHHMPAGDYQMMTILVVDNPHPEVPQDPTVQAALEAYPFRLYITRRGPLYL